MIKLPGDDFALRMAMLYEQLVKVMQEYQPDQAALESLFVHKNASSALKLGHARGLFYWLANINLYWSLNTHLG